MSRLVIDPNSPLPVYQQLKQSLILDIMSGKLKVDDSLPSIRELAKIMKVNPNTVSKVYNSLAEEGYIEGKWGSGYHVKAQKGRRDSLKSSMIEEEFRGFLEKAYSLGLTREDLIEITRRYLHDTE